MGAAVSCSDAIGCDTSITIPGDSALAASLSSKNINVKIEVADDDPDGEEGATSLPNSPSDSSPPTTVKHEILVPRRRNSGFLGSGVKEFEGGSFSRKSTLESCPSRKSTIEDPGPSPSFKQQPRTISTTSTASAPSPASSDDSNGMAENHVSADAELLLAARGGKLTGAERALSRGADLHCTDKAGRTPLFLAAGSHGKKNAELMKTLLAAKADIEAKDDRNWTPLHFACCDNRMEAASTLLHSGASVNAVTDDGRTPLILAIQGCNRRFGLIRCLIESKADLSVKDVLGASVLWFACQEGYREVVKLLLQEKADPNDDSDDGLTPLMIAARKGDVGIGKLLLQYKVDREAQGQEGNTAIIEALYSGMGDFATFLMEAGVSTLPKNKLGFTCAEIADQQGFMSLKAKLDQRYRIETGEAEKEEAAIKKLYLEQEQQQ